MKKLLTYGCLVIGLILGSTLTLKAQSSEKAMADTSYTSHIFEEGDIVVNGGIGLGAPYSTYGSSFGLPFGAGVEYGVTDLETGSIGVGADVGFSSSDYINVFSIGVKGSYHLNEILKLDNKKLDLYAGIGLYYRNYSFDNNFGFSGYNTSSSEVDPAFHIGGRYYFSDDFGVYGELGNSWGWLNVGVAYKF